VLPDLRFEMLNVSFTVVLEISSPQHLTDSSPCPLKGKNAFLDRNYYPVKVMTGHCDRYCGRCHNEGPQFPLYLADNLVVISSIDRADVTPHTITLVKIFE
jgi:hypothetical protein